MPAPWSPFSGFSCARSVNGTQSIPHRAAKAAALRRESKPASEQGFVPQDGVDVFMASPFQFSLRGTRAFRGMFPVSQKEKRARSTCPPTIPTKKRLKGRGAYSNFSVITGNCSLALARDLTTMPSAVSAVVLREVAISLTSRYLARSSIFFSRKERGLLRLRETRLLRTAATSISDPVRMRSEFSLKRCFQSGCEFSFPFSRNPRTFEDSLERITDRSPTVAALDCGTITRKPLETIRIM